MAFFSSIWFLASVCVEVAGIILALRAILISRTPQAGIGWAFALVLFPVLGIPFFLVFGESQFTGYTKAGQGTNARLDAALRAIAEHMRKFIVKFSGICSDGARAAGNLSQLPPTTGNDVQLLIDGEETFAAIFAAIDRATESVWVQFFIIRDDRIGRDLSARLIAALERGVECRILYDKVGSKGLPSSWCTKLRAAGAHVLEFSANRRWGVDFQINFRNHRKLVLVDGRVALIGGLNVGDEYLGRDKTFGPWRDTHTRIEGPAVAGFQISFLEDWNYIVGEVPPIHVRSTPPNPSAQAGVFPIASGPAETWNACGAVYLSVIQDAQHRLWLASPYFVPSSPLLYAICHAALRGVDVRIILPRNPDHLLPWLSSFTYYPKLLAAGVKVWRYQPGFMHQKVLLADDDFAIVGSVNLDYRSFLLNFEMSAAIQDKTFASRVEAMFLEDFQRSEPEDLQKFDAGSIGFRLKCRAAALISPEQ